MKKIMFVAAAAIAMASCGVDYQKTASGLVYKIYEGKGGDSAKPGNYVKCNVQVFLTDRTGKEDSVLTPQSDFPNYLPCDTSKRAEASFMEIIPKLREGDSAVINVSVDTLKSKRLINPADSVVFVKGSNIQYRVKVTRVFKEEKDVMADYEKETKLEEARQTKQVEDYIAGKGLKDKAKKTPHGAYVVVDNAGDAALKADSGKQASIKYKGYLMSDNSKIFDTNMDSSKGHTDPIDVVVGQSMVIPGWHDALPFFGKGGSGKILIPSFLGYGPQGRQPEILPNTNLIFDIEVLDVKDAPPMPERRMPGQMPQ
ncbi:FKBP-type peptidyl-prolyl cis-trans isomerase [Panacibacter sp. DH6]|uniref:Peptidyl-prolyl cis-trans isomerase n=1 Tax=Panacibacter microcysteis TaxID=2793269 RepID=A0A931MCC8_9BACT|nr:FKBP-type peptidyl-prolyl cis-trans isomerase [Panacibacter microcysteis]MBG9378020.1 FKBP-type peptidyl-prolyl cis-trans isomerase [Panacibacter microcysteis]